MEISEVLKDFVTHVVEAINQNAAIPMERRLWSISTIAKYAEKSVSTIQQKVICRHDFPEPVREYPGAKPRWVAREVMDFYESKR